MNIKEKYEEYGLYDIGKVIEDFEKDFGMSYPEITAELYNIKSIITKEDVINYCITNFSNLYESKYYKSIDNSIIDSRLTDYEVYYKKAEIYRDKAMKLLDIIMYLYYNDVNANEEKEKYLKELDINHYKNIIVGRDIIRILEALKHNLEKYKSNRNKINNLETYNRINHDKIYFMSRHAYPNESLIDKEGCDKTCLTRTKKIIEKKV